MIMLDIYLCSKGELYKSRMISNVFICMIKTKNFQKNWNVGERNHNDTKHI